MNKKNVNYIASMISEIQIGTDRAAAILITAELDDILLDLFKKYLVPRKRITKNDIDIFSNNGPLGTFGNRIEFLYRLGIIDKIICHDLHLVRRIRNDFAHKTHGITFATPIIHDKIKNFKTCKLKDGKGGKILSLDLSKPREAFTNIGALLHGNLSNLEGKIGFLKEKFPFIEELIEN